MTMKEKLDLLEPIVTALGLLSQYKLTGDRDRLDDCRDALHDCATRIMDAAK